MGNIRNWRDNSAASKSSAFNRHPLAVACAAALLLAGNGSYAQDVEPAKTEAEAAQAEADAAKAKAAAARRKGEVVKELDAVTVTGIRRGIENAIQSKKDATSIVEVISAEDIGKLPDSSIAESIARAPGLAAQRVAGRASTISIRGLSGDFSTTLLNGRDQVSVGDNRGVEYDQYPSELINGVTIYKTPDARLVGQGLSGTVNLQTLKPLSFAGRQIALNARVEQNSLGEVNPGYSDTGHRLSATYINQFADNTVGLAVGIARLDSPGQNEQFRWYDDGGRQPLGTVNGVNGVGVPGGGNARVTSTDNVRTGIVGVLEYRPNDRYSSTLDVFYSKFDKVETARSLEMSLISGWGGATLTNATVQDGLVVGGTFTNLRPVVRSDENKANDRVYAAGWNQELKLNDDWTAVVDLSTSSAKRDDRLLELYAGRVDNNNVPLSDTATYTLDEDGMPTFVFGQDYSDPSVVRLTNSAGWGQSGYLKSPQIRDKLYSARGSLKRDFLEGPISSVEFGLNYANREKSRSSTEFILRLLNPLTAVPVNLLQDPGTLGHIGSGVGIISYDIGGLYESGLYANVSNVNNDIYNKNWAVTEKVTTGYAQANLDTDWGSVPVRGNFGLQVVRTNQSSDGFSITGSTATPYTAGATYTDVLPSANLAFSFAYDQTLRIAAARQIARARMDQMRASNGVGCNFGGNIPVGQCRWGGGGGNPTLKPTLANAFDISYEKYFGVKAYVGLAAFYKDLQTYIFDSTILFDYSDFTPPAGLTPVRLVDNFSAPANGEGGKIYGEEFTLSVPFNLFSESLDGFGTVINVSNTRSSIQPNGPNGASEPIPGLSKLVSNVTFYYEKNGFSTRISQRKRSSFVGEITGFGADRNRVFIKPESVVDFQAGYEFGDGSLKGLSVLLQVNNLTNERYAQYFELLDGPRLWGTYGRTTLLGLNYKF